jgi:hypothetical protein
LAVLVVIQPPQVNPTMARAIAPPAAPQRAGLVSEGSCIAFLSNERELRCTQRADVPIAGANGTRPERIFLGSNLAPADGIRLPAELSGDLGTSPFYGQPWDKPSLVHKSNMGTSEAKHKKLVAETFKPREWTLLASCIIFRS